MNTKLENKENIRSEFDELFSNITPEEELEHGTQMIMFRYLSEVERIAEEKGIVNRKDLAQLIGITPSYLTQLFRGNKKLNFETVAKFQKALDVVFEIKAVDALAGISYIKDEQINMFLRKFHTTEGFWAFHTNKIPENKGYNMIGEKSRLENRSETEKFALSC